MWELPGGTWEQEMSTDRSVHSLDQCRVKKQQGNYGDFFFSEIKLSHRSIQRINHAAK